MKQEVSHLISCFMIGLHPFTQEINKGPSGVNNLEILFLNEIPICDTILSSKE